MQENQQLKQQIDEVINHQFVATHKRISEIIIIIDDLRKELKYLRQELHIIKSNPNLKQNQEEE